MNTQMTYRYADKTNCRQFTTVVVDGTITWEQIAPFLASRQSFIPGQIGLEDLQYRFALPGRDHPWHQIVAEDIRPTDAKPTITLSGDELAWRFANTSWDASPRTGPALVKATKPSFTRTATETPGTSEHIYAQDKQPSTVGASGARAKQQAEA